MKKIRKLIILSLLTLAIIVIMFIFYNLELGYGTRTGNFHFIRKGDNGIEFIVIPE